jgi:dolichol kinase
MTLSLEVRRQIFHLLFSLILVILINYGIIGPVTLSIILIVGLFLSYLSLHYKLPMVNWFLEKFERKNAEFPGEGAFFLVLGVTIVTVFFPSKIALASVMILALGDSFAHLLGKAYGKRPFADKTLFGTLSGIVFGFFGALFFVDIGTAFLGSFFVMFFEAFNLKVLGIKINDNLFIPLVSSIIMYIWMIL